MLEPAQAGSPRRWSDGAKIAGLLAPRPRALAGVCKGFQARLDTVESWQAQRRRNRKNGGAEGSETCGTLVSCIASRDSETST